MVLYKWVVFLASLLNPKSFPRKRVQMGQAFPSGPVCFCPSIIVLTMVEARQPCQNQLPGVEVSRQRYRVASGDMYILSNLASSSRSLEAVSARDTSGSHIL